MNWDPSTWQLPAWAVSDEAQAWFYGFTFGALARITKAALKWFKRVSHETIN